jgi:PAS domain S-box-containing protein
LEILEDPSGELTIDQVASPEFDARFSPSQEEVPNYGFTDSVYWVRLSLKNETRLTDEWLLEQGFANTHYVYLYTPLPEGDEFAVKQTGTLRPPTTRDISHPRIIFNLAIPPQSQQTYYLRFQNGASMTLPLTLWTQKAFLDNALVEQIAHGVFFGVLIGLLFYNLFLLVSLREASYLYFVILLASLILEEATYEGYLLLYAPPNLFFVNRYFIPLFFSLLIASMVLFSDTFLELKKRLPKFHWVNLVILAVWGALIFLTPFTSYHVIANLMAPWAVVSLLAAFIAGIGSWRRGFRPARFFLIAWLGLIASFVWLLLVRLGISPSTFFSENIYRLGYLWMAVCWSIALADRINLLKAEREKANLELQASERRYRQLVEKMNDGLGVIDEHGRFTYINHRLAEMLGYPAEEIIGHLATEFTVGVNQQTLASQMEARKTGSSQPYELTWRRKDGEEIFTLISPVPLFGEDGRYTGAFAVITDITERVRASRTLEQRVEERTRELSTLLGISRDISGWRDLTVVLDRILVRLKSVVAYHGLVILAEEQGKWRILAQDWPDLSTQPDPIELSAEEVQIIVKDFAQGEPVLISNIDLEAAQEAGFGRLATSLSSRGIAGIRCWLGVPLFEKESIIGAMVVGCDQTGTSEDQIKVIVASANQAAIAIENNRLYRQMREAVMSEERNRLARDLHDSVTQSLFSATLLADVLPQVWQRDPEQGLQRLEKLRRLMRGALAELRSMLLELRPSALLNAPLADLLAQLTEASASRSGLPFQLYLEQIPALPEAVQTSFYRIAQEALNNVVKHAQAKQVTVSLSETPFPPEGGSAARREVRLVIQDDGVGYATVEANSTHLGIGIMRERAGAIGANLTLESQPGRGTQVILIWRSAAESET